MTREMKNSGVEWIGQIPANWEMRKIKYILRERNEKNEPIKSNNILSLTASQGVIPHSEKEGGGNKPKEDLSAYKLAYPDDIVMNSMNILSGSVGLSKYFGCVSPVYYMLYSDDDNVNIKYYNYIFQTTVFQKSLMGLGNGIMMKETEDGKLNTIRMRIPLEKLNGLLLPIPSKEEQEKIVSKLESVVPEIDKMIAETKSSIENYKEYKQSVITEAVTKGLNKDVQMKDSGIEWIGEIPADWEVVKIKYVSKVSRGLFNHRPRNDERYYYGAYPFIQTGDVASADKYITKYSQTLNELGKSVSKEFPKGTLTMTIAANIGDVSILGFDSYFPDSVIGFIPNENIQNIYLYYIFKAMKEQFINASVMNTQLNLNIERVREIFIPITYNQDKQQKIIDYLDKQCAEIDNLISEKEALIVNLEEYKKSLIYEYVTGKKSVL